MVRALRALAPEVPITYVADTGGFPYGAKSPEELLTRARAVLHQLKAQQSDTVVLACNTLSTLCLEALRASCPSTFVGTVPAIKTAAQLSKTRRFTLLATPNTAHSRYSDGLIAEFAADCVVDITAAPNLATLTEQWLLDLPVADEDLRREITLAFHDDAKGRTDAIVLGCTHYPLILERLRPLAPWPVAWIDSSEAIARRALAVAVPPPIGGRLGGGQACSTSQISIHTIQDSPLPNPRRCSASSPVGEGNSSVAYVTDNRHFESYEALFAGEGFARTELLATIY